VKGEYIPGACPGKESGVMPPHSTPEGEVRKDTLSAFPQRTVGTRTRKTRAFYGGIREVDRNLSPFHIVNLVIRLHYERELKK
jgi:hypothetical protein